MWDFNMIHMILVYGSIIFLVAIFYISVNIGRRIGVTHIENQTHPKTEIVGVAESAVFGLLALLIAFTFSGAYDRFESRKMHIVEEASAFERAYDYIDLVPTPFQAQMRDDVRHYFDAFIDAINDIPFMNEVEADLQRAQTYEDKIWRDTVQAANSTDNKSYPQIYMPAISDMFEAVHTGYYITQIHPPIVIFILLIILSVLGAFLVGYNSAENKQKYPLHSLSYVILTSFTIYIIINIEFPHIGLIDMPAFNDILIRVRHHMQ